MTQMEANALGFLWLFAAVVLAVCLSVYLTRHDEGPNASRRMRRKGLLLLGLSGLTMYLHTCFFPDGEKSSFLDLAGYMVHGALFFVSAMTLRSSARSYTIERHNKLKERLK